jgi:hypothetical protein
MRYVIAMLVAIVVDAARHRVREPAAAPSGGQTVSPSTSPDEVGNLEDGVYMLSNLAALLIGWTIGWSSAALVSKPVPPAERPAEHDGTRD